MGKKLDFFQEQRKHNSSKSGFLLANELFPGTQWYTQKLEPRKLVITATSEATIALTESSEKQKALESLAEFAKREIETSSDAKIVFPGGEVGLKEGATLGRRLSIAATTTSPNWVSSEAEIIFYGESSQLSKDPEAQDKRASELLDKMVSAMRLPGNQVIKILSSTNIASSQAELDSLMAGVLNSRPKFLVSLGAGATNAILGRKEKLTRIHGQFFPLTINNGQEEHEALLMPLFHPDFLLINPNMKRTAWLDLQKIMKEMGISPT